MKDLKEPKRSQDHLKAGKHLLISVSGIRGIIPHGLGPENVTPFIQAFAQVTGNKIVVGRDSRPSGFFLHQLTVGTLLTYGKQVIDVGIVPTPTVKYAVSFFKAQGGIMISASHNPIQWNGFKFIDKNALFFNHSSQKAWQQALKTQSVQSVKSVKKISKMRDLGSYTKQEVVIPHVDAVLDFLSKKECTEIQQKKYTVVVDAVGGAGGGALTNLLKKLGCKVIPLYCNPTPLMQKFPRPPEPVPAALKKLGSLVKKHRAAIGFGLDPDADRLVISSLRRGAVHEEYTLPLALLGLEPRLQQRMEKGKPNYIVINLSTASLCGSLCAPYKCKIFRSPVGEAHVVDWMRKKKAVFGGEGNGGVILPDIPSWGRDPLAGAALILSAMARKKANSVDDLLDSLPSLFMSKSKYKLKAPSSQVQVQKVSKKFLLQFPKAKADYQDGLHLSLPDKSWLHLRSSNTEPILRLIVEGSSRKSLKEITAKAKKILMFRKS